MKAFKAQKKEVAYFMRRLYKQGLTSTSGGNISLRLPNNLILITPSQTDKGRMRSAEIGTVTLEGVNQNPEIKLSMETGMHLAVFNARPDVNAIVHAHPVTATAFAAAHLTINTALMGESRAILGEPLLAAYALMGTNELAQSVANAIKKTNIVLMSNHGVLAVGNSLLEAFDRIEVLENCAKINLITKQLGEVHPLDKEQLKAIDTLMGL